MKTILLPVITLLLSHCTAEAQTTNTIDAAPPKTGVIVAPPVSADPPAEYTKLPRFGSINWKTHRLPWVNEGPYAGISGTAMVAHGDRIYVVGGFIPGGDSSEDKKSGRTSRWTQVYHTKSGSWQRLQDSPFRREYTRGIVADDVFYLVGGACLYKGEDPKYRVFADCAALNLTIAPPAWRSFDSLNVARTHVAIGSVGHFLIVAGGNEYDFSENGYSQRTIRDTTEVLDLSKPDRSWEIRAAIPGPGRGWAASVAAERHLYVFGGVTFVGSGAAAGTKETLRYDPIDDNWQSMTAPPLSISGWEGDLFANRYALIVGGVVRPDAGSEDDVIWSDVVWAYDTQEDLWLRVDGVLPPGAVFNDSGVAIIGDTIYVLGAEGPHGSHYNYFVVGRIKPEL